MIRLLRLLDTRQTRRQRGLIKTRYLLNVAATAKVKIIQYQNWQWSQASSSQSAFVRRWQVSAACSCEEVGRVEQYKYLDAIVDCTVCRSPHFEFVKQRVRKLVYAFSHLRRVLSVVHCWTDYPLHTCSPSYILVSGGLMGGGSWGVVEGGSGGHEWWDGFAGRGESRES